MMHILTNVCLTICVKVLYNGKDSTIHTTFVVILCALQKHKNIVIGYIFRCFEARDRQKSTSAYQLVKTLSICKCGFMYEANR